MPHIQQEKIFYSNKSIIKRKTTTKKNRMTWLAWNHSSTPPTFLARSQLTCRGPPARDKRPPPSHQEPLKHDRLPSSSPVLPQQSASQFNLPLCSLHLLSPPLISLYLFPLNATETLKTTKIPNNGPYQKSCICASCKIILMSKKIWGKVSSSIPLQLCFNIIPNGNYSSFKWDGYIGEHHQLHKLC